MSECRHSPLCEIARAIEGSDGDFDRHAIDAMEERYGYARRIREALGVEA